MNTANIITLTTDFGLEDAYVGQLKGAVLTRNPQVQLVDLCHAIAPQDIPAAAISLYSSYSFFPPGTVHLVVVDPGVGSQRRLLAAASVDQLFIAPDNGILSLLLRDGIFRQIHLLENKSLFHSRISSTFHGRDIMAPVAAALAGGMALAEVGPACSPASCVRLELPTAEISLNRIRGEVLQLDHFGNIRTSITLSDLAGFAPPQQLTVSCKEQQINGICTSYADVPPGTLTALFDSSLFLEIAVNQGNAGLETGAKAGDPVTVQGKNR